MNRLIAVLLVLLSGLTLQAQTVTLAWDPPSDGITTGYEVLYGTYSQSYTQQIDAGLVTQYTVSGLLAGSTYYFAVKAYDAAGDRSAPSSEVSTVLPSAVITALSLVSNVPSPQPVGFYVTWTASASGGVTPNQFQFWTQKNLGAWTLGRDWGGATWAWAPTFGDYIVRVDARSAGASISEMSQSMPFVIAKACKGSKC